MPALSKPLNPFQPKRPLKHPETGERLMYRLYPQLSFEKTRNERIYRTCEISNRICQIQLYRWTFDEGFIQYPSINELYEYLITSVGLTSSKGHFGRTVTNALDYNPRKLKGVTLDNPKACQIYTFRNELDLRYGLEYQICSWLRRFLKDHSAPGEEEPVLEEELAFLGSCSWEECQEIYINPMMEFNARQYEEPKWKELLKKASSLGRDEDGIEEFAEIERGSENRPAPSGTLRNRG